MQKKPIVGILLDNQFTGVDLWRLIRPWTDLSKAGLIDLRLFSNKVSEYELFSIDVLCISMPGNEKYTTLYDTCRNIGCKIWVDIDDNASEVPIHNQFYHEVKDAAGPILKAGKLADIVSFSTYELAEKHKGDFNYSVVLQNSIHEHEMAANWSNNDRILWRGNFSQLRDMWEHWHQYGEFTRKGFDFLFVGVAVPWVKAPHWLQWTPASSYFDFLRQLNPAFIWKPLEDNEFNRCKSNIALLEGAVCGALTITNLPWEYAMNSIDRDLGCEFYENYFQQMKTFITEEFNAKTENQKRLNALIEILQ